MKRALMACAVFVRKYVSVCRQNINVRSLVMMRAHYAIALVYELLPLWTTHKNEGSAVSSSIFAIS